MPAPDYTVATDPPSAHMFSVMMKLACFEHRNTAAAAISPSCGAAVRASAVLLQDAIEAYGRFDEREAGWIKTAPKFFKAAE